jgi:nucleotide-binding universal stress UspA family protein
MKAMSKTRKRSAKKSPAAGSKGKFMPAAEGLEIKTVLVPTDFSENSFKGIASALSVVRKFKARIILLHVIEPRMYPAEFGYLAMEDDRLSELARAQLKELARSAGLGARLEKTLVRSGQAYTEITAAARGLKADLIVLSTQGFTGLKHVLLGSTAERVVRHAHCPVLVAR